MQGVAESIISNVYARARAEEWQKMVTEKSTEQFMIHVKPLMKKK